MDMHAQHSYFRRRFHIQRYDLKKAINEDTYSQSSASTKQLISLVFSSISINSELFVQSTIVNMPNATVHSLTTLHVYTFAE